MSRLSSGARLLGLSGEPLILASISPRRRELLRMLGVRFDVHPPDVGEGNSRDSELPSAYVERLARAKASVAVDAGDRYAVLAADTIVYLDQEILEKPANEAHAKLLLRRLSGRWHEVYTGVALRRLNDQREVWGHECSRVRFSEMDDDLIAEYVATGEPMDKAGAYGIQGYGGLLVDRIEGCYFNVMGLPLPRLRRLVHELELDR